MRAALDRVMATAPAGGRGALGVDVALTGVEVNVTHRISPRWSVGGYAGVAWRGGRQAGARLTGSW